MTLEQAFFILRHGSAEGEHKYFEAILVIENEYNRQKAKIEALQMDNKQLETDNFNANMNCEHLQAEIERLRDSRDRWRQIALIYDEVIKENEKAGETE